MSFLSSAMSWLSPRGNNASGAPGLTLSSDVKILVQSLPCTASGTRHRHADDSFCITVTACDEKAGRKDNRLLRVYRVTLEGSSKAIARFVEKNSYPPHRINPDKTSLLLDEMRFNEDKADTKRWIDELAQEMGERGYAIPDISTPVLADLEENLARIGKPVAGGHDAGNAEAAMPPDAHSPRRPPSPPAAGPRAR